MRTGRSPNAFLPFWFTTPRGCFFLTPDGDPPSGGAGGGGSNSGAGGTADAGTGGGAGGDNNGGTGDGGGNPPKARTYTQQEFNEVTRTRDRLRKDKRALLQRIGVDNPDEVTITYQNDPDQPVVIEGLDEVTELIERGRSAPDANPAERKRQQGEFRKRVETPLKRELSALRKWIEQNAVIGPIRQACRDEHIVDDDGGQFNDVVRLVAPRMPVRIEVDGDTANVLIDSVDDAGTVLRNDATDEPWSPRQMVADLAKRKPKYREATFRPGPGAGGQDRRQSSPAAGNGSGTATTGSHDYVADAVQRMTGIRPPSASR